MGGLQTSGPTARALDELWQSLRSPHRRLFSRRILRELELRASFDLDLLSSRRVTNDVPVGKVPDCSRCDDICCAGLENIVSLRLSDIARIIDVGRTDLISKKKPRFPETLLDRRPNLRELVASELFRTLPVLRQLGDERICAALTPEMQCSLYPNWPLSCERFPYSLLAARRRVVYGSRCQSHETREDATPRARELFEGAVSTYNERIKDAVILAHARPALDAVGIGAFLVGPNEDPFEEATLPRLLPILR